MSEKTRKRVSPTEMAVLAGLRMKGVGRYTGIRGRIVGTPALDIRDAESRGRDGNTDEDSNAGDEEPADRTDDVDSK